MQNQPTTAQNISAAVRSSQSWGKVPLPLTHLTAPGLTDLDHRIWHAINRATQIQARRYGDITAADLAATCGCQERSARRSIARLKTAGVVSVDSKGGRFANHYGIPGGYIARKPAASAVNPDRTLTAPKLNPDPGVTDELNNTRARQYKNRISDKESTTAVVSTGQDKNLPRSQERTRTAEPARTPGTNGAEKQQPNKQPEPDRATAMGALRTRGVIERGVTGFYSLVRDYGAGVVMGAAAWFDAENRRRRARQSDLIGAGMLVRAVQRGYYSGAPLTLPKEQVYLNGAGSRAENQPPPCQPAAVIPISSPDPFSARYVPVSAPRGWSPPGLIHAAPPPSGPACYENAAADAAAPGLEHAPPGLTSPDQPPPLPDLDAVNDLRNAPARRARSMVSVSELTASLADALRRGDDPAQIDALFHARGNAERNTRTPEQRREFIEFQRRIEEQQTGRVIDRAADDLE